MSRKPLTLAKCLGQTHGTEGRLFQPAESAAESLDVYRVLRVQGNSMCVEVRGADGAAQRIDGLPLDARRNDVMLTSKQSMKYYSAGKNLPRPEPPPRQKYFGSDSHEGPYGSLAPSGLPMGIV
jgi:hypothetical protein